ncbi:MAG: hypothetical protein WCO57_04130 [Verrucomicrobiota bacterium]
MLTPLALASLRRGFRAHLVRRGEHEQLDFFHAQMRRAVLDRCVPDAPACPPLHSAISDFLESLPASDPLIRLERMAQLIGQRDALRAARYYATLEVDSTPPPERLGSTWTLVEWIAEAELGGAHASSVHPAASRGRDLHSESPANPTSPGSPPGSTKQSLRQQRWDAAETYYTRLLDLGEPLAEIVPRLVACLLNAHEELSPGACARIGELLAKLESAGHTDLALQVRATYTARLPRKPWWKRWG